jgi:hypothetical protein
MPKCVRSISRMARAIPLAVMLTFAAGGAATAAEECLASPNRQADPGTRWSQRTVNNRQCWYLKKDAATAPASAAPVDPAASANADDQSNIMSWLSSKFGSMRSGSTGTEQTATQAIPEAQPKPKPSVAKRSDPGKARPRQPTSAASGQPSTAAPFDAETREALFKEYLEWRKQQPGAK